MNNTLETICLGHAVLCRSFGVVCLAFVGVISVVGGIAKCAYKLGQEEKEYEMKRELKKRMKQLKKKGP